MFRDTLHLPVKTPKTPFVAPANIHTIEAFMSRVDYQGVVDKKFSNIPKRLKEDYHSVKDDVSLVSVYTTGNVLVRGTLISDAFLTVKIRETDDFKEYETVFMKVAIPMNQLQPVVSTQGVNRNTPIAPRTPNVSASPQESKKRKQTAGESCSRRIIIKKKKQSTPSIPPPGDGRERDEMEEIDKLVDGNKDEESYASAFVDSVINNDDDDTGSKLEPRSHKEHLEHMSDDDETKRKDEEVKKEKEDVEIVKETNVDDISAKNNNEFVTKKKLLIYQIKEVIQHCDTIVTGLTLITTNDMLKKEMPCLVKLIVNKDREVSSVDISGMVSKEFAAHRPKLIEELFQKHKENITLNLYPKTNSSTATTSSVDLQ
nr:hypothetical protein [Tanacetum cinerariifolium]